MALPPKPKEKGILDAALNVGPLGNVYRLLNEGQQETVKRTAAQIGFTVPREALELSRMIVTPDKTTIDKQEEFLEDYLGYMVGSENVEMDQRGEEEAGGYSVASIKDPENDLAQIVSTVGGFVTGMVGAGKFKKGAEFLGKKTFKKKIPKVVPSTKLGAAAAYTGRQASSGAIASQIGFNPYDEQMAEWLGEFMPEDTGWKGDLKDYLTADRQTKTQLENRIDLLAEGAFLGLGVAAVGGMFKGGKYLSEAELKDKFVVGFKNSINKIGQGTSDTLEAFVKKLDLDYTKSDTAQRKATLAHRNQDVIDGKVVDMGDIDAMKPSKYTKWLSDVNLQFSDSPILRKLDNLRSKLVTTRGGRSRALNEKFLKTENIKEKWSDNINNTAYNLEKSLDDLVLKVSDGNFFSNNRLENKEKFLKKLSDVLYTDFRSPTIVTGKSGIKLGKRQKPTFEKELQSNFPEEMWDDIRQARNLQDNLSKLMLESNTLTNAQKKIYTDSLGFYVRRSFKLYEDSNYVPSKDSLKEARKFLEEEILKENPNIAPEDLILEVAAKMKIIEGKGAKAGSSFTQNLDKFDRVRKEILNGRKDIPPPIKNFLGEIEDPIQALIYSTTKLSKYVEDIKFYNDAFEEGSEIYFKSKPSGVFTEEIGEGYGKLSKTFTTPEMKEYFSSYQKFGQQTLETNELSIRGGVGWAYRNTLLLKGLSQAAKTVYSHATHFKNFIGGNHMSLANGVNTLNPAKSLRIVKTLRAKTRRDKDAQAYHEELSGRGLLSKGVVARDIEGLAKDISKVKKGFLVGKVDWAFGKLGLKYVAKKAQNFYIGTDDFYKVNMYESEQVWLNDFNKALPNNVKFDTYRFKNLEAIKDEAATMTRDTLPNYDLVPEILKDLRRVPFVGKFFSFMSESVRISQGTLRRAHKEITTGKALKAEGATEAGDIILKRGTNRLAAFTVMGGVGAKAVEEGSKAVYGVTTDVVDAARDMLPDYMQNANLFVTVKEDGTPTVANISTWDAYDFPKKPLQVLSRRILNSNNVNDEELYKDMFTTLTSEMVAPFIGESLIQEQLSNYIFSDGMTNDKRLMRNPFNKSEQYDNSGTQIENALNKDNLNILMANIFQTVLPGSIDRGIDWAKTLGKEQTEFDQDIYPVDQAIKFLTGWGTQPFNKEYVENVFSFKASKLSKEKGFRRRRVYNAIDKNLDNTKFINNYLKENQQYAKSYAKTHKLIKSGNTFNLDVNALLQDSGFNVSDRIYLTLGDSFKPLGITKDMDRMLMENSSSLKQYQELKQDLNVIDLSLSNIPIIFDPDNYKQTGTEVFEDLRENYKTGGIVPNVQEDPKDRKNPILQESYKETSKGLTDLQKIIGVANEVLKPKEQMESLGFKRVTLNKGGMTDTINSYLTKYRTQSEKQYKKRKDGKFLKDKNGELIDAGYNKEVNKEPDKFVKDMYLKLKESGHPFPKMAAAQAGAESEYGMSALSRKANNTFGVKVRKGEKFEGVMMPTKEDYGQGQVDEVANFRAYDTVDDNIKGYINFLNTGNYDKALNAKSDMEYLQELKNSGYATDQDYVTTVGSVYKRNLESGTFD